MKLLIATPLYPPDIGGPATFAKILKDELPKHGEEVAVLSFGGVRHLPKGVAHIAYAWKIFRALSGVDTLLALDPVSVGLPAAIVSFFRPRKFIVRIVGDYAWEQGRQRFGVAVGLDEFVTMPGSKFSLFVRLLRAVQCFVASRAERIIVPSNYLKHIVASWGIPAGKIAVVYNAFDGVPQLPEREAVRKDLSWKGPVIFSAGRLVPWKGFATLIGLMPEIVKHHPNAKLYIAGSGPMEGELKVTAIDAGLKDRAVFLGDVPKEKLYAYVRGADCFVLNTGYEGFSHQLLEVLALGTPIVTTLVGGNPELVEHGRTGILVGYNDAVALRMGIEDVILHPENARQMAEKGKAFAENFTVDRMVAGALAVIHEVGPSK